MAIFNRFFKRGKAGPKETKVPGGREHATAPPQKPGSKPAKKPEKAAKAAKAPEPAPPVDAMTPEERCGITPKMPRDEIREHLKLLFRRHNRLASSMDLGARNEAEYMLDIIVQMREKYLG